MSKVFEVIDNMNKDKAMLTQRVKALYSFMREKELPQSFRCKVRRYLEFAIEAQRTRNQDLNGILDLLSPGLQQELQGYLLRHTLILHPFFAELPIRVQNALCSGLEILLYAQGDCVYVAGSPPVGMFFILSGEVSIFEEGDDSVPLRMTDPSWFGDLGLFYPEQFRASSAVVYRHSELLFLGSTLVLQTDTNLPSSQFLLAAYNEYKGKLTNLTGAAMDTDTTTCAICGVPGHSKKYCKKTRGAREVAEITDEDLQAIKNTQRPKFLRRLETMAGPAIQESLRRGTTAR
jgi:hypothetical protein